VVAMVSLGAGCRYQDQPRSGAQQCAAPGQKRCPDGYACAPDNLCYRDGASLEADAGAGRADENDDSRTPDVGQPGSEGGVDVASRDLVATDKSPEETGGAEASPEAGMDTGGGVDIGPTCTPGAVDCACLSNGSCDVGLTCDQNLCHRATCGDGHLDQGERCDDGNTSNTDACLATCVPASCGDGFVRAGQEECDDGNTSNTDACTSACKLAKCGDGFVQAGEECDDGATDNSGPCLMTCKLAKCGDGFVDRGVEACDDGNTINTDGCTNACKLASCGDGITQTGEQCDDGNTSNTDSCTASCQLARCGDGFVQGTEQCDDGNTSNTDGCTSSCKKAACGDGFLQAGEECDDGNAIDTDSCRNTCTKHYNVAFVSSVTYDLTTLGGVSGADAKCQGLAMAAGLVTGGATKYVAWISDSHTSVASRLGAARGWVRPDMKPFLDDYNTATTFYPPEVTEKGNHVTDSPSALGGYTVASGAECDDWTPGSTGLFLNGDPTAGSGGWVGSYGGASCSSPFRIYCLGIDFVSTMTFTKTAGRLAFVSGSFAPTGGLTGADTQCQNDATAAGLANASTFKALLATTSASMASRFSTAGAVWVRVDGVPIVASPRDLFVLGGKMIAPLDVTADGTYLANYGGWSGSADPNLPGTAATTCNNWTSKSATGVGGRVLFSILSKAFAFDTANSCDNQYTYLYCLQP